MDDTEGCQMELMKRSRGQLEWWEAGEDNVLSPACCLLGLIVDTESRPEISQFAKVVQWPLRGSKCVVGEISDHAVFLGTLVRKGIFRVRQQCMCFVFLLWPHHSIPKNGRTSCRMNI